MKGVTRCGVGNVEGTGGRLDIGRPPYKFNIDGLLDARLPEPVLPVGVPACPNVLRLLLLGTLPITTVGLGIGNTVR